MKVLLIDVNCKYSSTGKIVYDLYTEINKRGDTAAICYGRGPKIKERGIYKFSGDIEVYIHAFLTRLTGLTGCFSFFATRNLLKYIKEFKPDIVHLHDLHAYFVNIKPLISYLKRKKIKTVWTFHCEFMYTGKCGYAYDCEKWKSGCGKCPSLREYPSSLFFDFTRKMFNQKKRLFEGFDNLTIVTPSEWLAGRVRQSFLKDKDIKVIHNGIDTDVFHPVSYEHLKLRHGLKDEKIVLAVAPDLMSERKGGKWVVELAKRFASQNVRFIMIGIDDLNSDFGENVISLGRLNDQNELAAYYSMADVFVICSKKENFPTTCIEALCCGTPVCGFDAGGTKETALDYGVFVEYGDIKNLYYAIHELLDKKINMPTDKYEISKYALKEYSTDRFYMQYEALYTK